MRLAPLVAAALLLLPPASAAPAEGVAAPGCGEDRGRVEGACAAAAGAAAAQWGHPFEAGSGQQQQQQQGVVLIQRSKPQVSRDTALLAALGTEEGEAAAADAAARRRGGRSPAQAAAAPAPDAPAVAAGGAVEIVSYNLFWWNVGANNKWEELYARIREERTFDLIGFQECNDVAHILKHSGLEDFEYFQGPGSNPCPLAWDPAVFERLSQPSSKRVAADVWGERHMTWVRLRHKATGARVFFANTHGPLGGCGDDLGDSWLAGIQDHMHQGDVAFMTGDFNCASGSAAVNKVNSLLTDQVDGGIDHIMTNGEALSGGNKKGQPSDHPLVKGRFSLSAKKVIKSVTPEGAADGCGRLEENVDYNGGNLPSVDVSFTAGAAECSQSCRDTDGCQLFTFAKEWNGCYLKSYSNEGDKPSRKEDDCCISGPPACGGGSAAPSPPPSSTGASTTAATTPAPSSPPAPSPPSSSTTAPPGADERFVLHEGVNCWRGHGADYPHDRDMVGVMTLSECKAVCESEPECTGVVVFHSGTPTNCWLRAHIHFEQCETNTPWDLWTLASSS